MKTKRKRYGMKRPAMMRRSTIQRRAFTLIELMVVVAIMGLILATGIPSIYRMFKKEGMRQAVGDVLDACSHARARAILQGSPVELVFHPLERRFEIRGASGGAAPSPVRGGDDDTGKSPTAHSGQAGQFSQDIEIGMLEINGLNYRESEWTRVQFFPNGTSDEMRVVLDSAKGEVLGIELEISTGLASVVSDLQQIQSWKIR
jgi:prepilin-type N-terminal cleavage/methylation domain-containing protein